MFFCLCWQASTSVAQVFIYNLFAISFHRYFKGIIHSRHESSWSKLTCCGIKQYVNSPLSLSSGFSWILSRKYENNEDISMITEQAHCLQIINFLVVQLPLTPHVRKCKLKANHWRFICKHYEGSLVCLIPQLNCQNGTGTVVNIE